MEPVRIQTGDAMTCRKISPEYSSQLLAGI